LSYAFPADNEKAKERAEYLNEKSNGAFEALMCRGAGALRTICFVYIIFWFFSFGPQQQEHDIFCGPR